MPAHFTIVGGPSSITTTAGSSFSFSVTVKNDGDASGTVEVRVRDHNNALVDSQTGTLDAGAQQNFDFTETAPSEPGTYQWKIEAYNTDTATVDDYMYFTIEVPYENPYFQIVTYPETVNTQTGKQFTVIVTVHNYGPQGDVEVRIKDHEGNIAGKTTATVVGGTDQDVEVKATAPSTKGTYTWYIEAYNVSQTTVDDTKSFTLNVEEAPPPPPPSLAEMVQPLLSVLMIVMVMSLSISLVTALMKAAESLEKEKTR